MSMNAFITGVHDTAVGELPGSSVMSLHAEAACGALADAGLAPGDIDGVICAYALTMPHLMLGSVFCEYMGIHPGFCTALSAGGASACSKASQASRTGPAAPCSSTPPRPMGSTNSKAAA